MYHEINNNHTFKSNDMPTIYSSCGDELRDIAEQNELPAYLDYEAYEGGENEHIRGNYVRRFGLSAAPIAAKHMTAGQLSEVNKIINSVRV